MILALASFKRWLFLRLHRIPLDVRNRGVGWHFARAKDLPAAASRSYLIIRWPRQCLLWRNEKLSEGCHTGDQDCYDVVSVWSITMIWILLLPVACSTYVQKYSQAISVFCLEELTTATRMIATAMMAIVAPNTPNKTSFLGNGIRVFQRIAKGIDKTRQH